MPAERLAGRLAEAGQHLEHAGGYARLGCQLGHTDGGGDIAISAPIAIENAARYGHQPADELKVLILHGMLHLAGYDHENDNGEMAAQEHSLRQKLKLPGSLIHRASSHGRTRP